MSNLRPILLKVEVGAVVEIVALEAIEYRFSEFLAIHVAFVFADRQSHGCAKALDLFFAKRFFPILRSHMGRPGAVAVFAAVLGQMRGSSEGSDNPTCTEKIPEVPNP